MELKKYLSAIIFLLLLMMIGTMVKCSDERKPEKQQGQVYYSFDWSHMMPESISPKQLRYCFYPKDGGSVIMMDCEAGDLTFTLPPASYRVLIFNCDADKMAFRNMTDYETAEAYIPATKANGGTETGSIPLYGVAVEELRIEAGENKPVAFTPEPLVRRISININIKGAEYVAECCGSISGMAAALSLSKQAVVPNVTTDVDFKATPTAAGVQANVMMLGKTPEKTEEKPETPSHTVTLEITLEDGSTASTSFEIGSEIEDTEGDNVDIEIDATLTPGPTFTLTINHWEVAPGDSLIID